MSWKSKRGAASPNLTILLCIGCFCAGMLFTHRVWTVPEAKSISRTAHIGDQKREDVKSESKYIPGDVSRMHHAVQTLDNTILNLEMELAAARALQDSITSGSPITEDLNISELTKKRKYIMVIGINTAFSSRKRRDSVRATWMPQGDKLKKLEEEKGIVMRFVIGHSATSGGILDRAIEAEEKQHGDFLRLLGVYRTPSLSIRGRGKVCAHSTRSIPHLWDYTWYVVVVDNVNAFWSTPEHVEGYLELSAKTKSYFTTAIALWDADFYVKVDDDVHVNIGTLAATLATYRSKPRVYIGCMKSGPVLAEKGVRYHEPEHWKFGEDGNRYFRHATGQLYAISKDLATYISINRHILHKYANEDVTLGSWFIGLDVEHIDDRKMCCGTPPDCEWKAQTGNVCVASFDWSCSGICKSVERIKEVHRRCGESENALWNTVF